MTPEEYEHLVAEMLRAEGWDAHVTPYTHDFGVDVIAERHGSRLAVQAKMFGGANRPVAATMVTQLYGAAAFADCEKAMIVTDGRVRAEAQHVAKKVRVEIRALPATGVPQMARAVGAQHSLRESVPTFGRIWNEFVIPMARRTLMRANGKSNTIVHVDNSCLERQTSSGRRQRIDVEIFRWAIESMLQGTTVSRDDINARYPGRASSGIALVLSNVPLFERLRVNGKECLRMRSIDR